MRAGVTSGNAGVCVGVRETIISMRPRSTISDSHSGSTVLFREETECNVDVICVGCCDGLDDVAGCPLS